MSTYSSIPHTTGGSSSLITSSSAAGDDLTFVYKAAVAQYGYQWLSENMSGYDTLVTPFLTVPPH
jgi:hypothetical protein